jgi:hypothetical protein
MVSMAIVFMEELSRKVASAIFCMYSLSFLEDIAILILVCVSLWAMRLKI